MDCTYDVLFYFVEKKKEMKGREALKEVQQDECADLAERKGKKQNVHNTETSGS
jgi:hypothetical protein